MPWHPDVPDFIIEKPHELEKIERLSPEVINAMNSVEIDEHIEDAAFSLARAYHDKCQKRRDYGLEECILIVSGALSQTGSSIKGKMGPLMVGKSQEQAKMACQQYFQSGQEESEDS